MKKKIGILHYAGPPTVGGVEATIAYHARELVALGYSVRVVSGSGAAFDSRVENAIYPLFGSTVPEVLKVKTELDAGYVTDTFETLVARLDADLSDALSDCNVCIAHNVLTLNKNLPLSAALHRQVNRQAIRLIGWCHDLAWTNPQYQPEMHDGYPWELLRQRWPRTRYVTVSEARRGELAELLGIAPEAVTVVVPGIDPQRFFRWTTVMCTLEAQLHLLDADGLLLVPARLTRRKNIELVLRVLAEVRGQSGRDFRLIVTGPPGPHNPSNPGYLGELLNLRRALGLDNSAHFLYAYGSGGQPLVPDDDTIANLYQIADALLFPSTQEGFGIPVLEAGLTRLPEFCADIPALRDSGQRDVTYFDPLNEAPATIAVRILDTLDTSPTYRLQVRVRQHYRWDVLIRQCLVPLLEED